MLVLSRKRGEKIVVPQCSMTVTVVELQGSTVRLGISAPPEVAVHREELWRQIQDEGSQSAKNDLGHDSLEAFAAELSAAAYQIALRHGLADSWVDLELGLRGALASTVENWSRKPLSAAPNSKPRACEDQPARLPR
jgi:carbon storage regulator